MTWQSSLSLGFANSRGFANGASVGDNSHQIGARHGRTTLNRKHHSGALYVQRALYPEPASQSGICHVILLYPPAGIASGDQLSIDISLEADSHALLTTPGAGKWYGKGLSVDHSAANFVTSQHHTSSPQQPDAVLPVATQSISAEVAANATLEWLPQENIFFNHANMYAKTHIELAASASVLMWDISVFGRKAYDEDFTQGNYHNELLITREGRPLVFEQVNQPATSRWFTSPLGLNQQHVMGTFWAIPATELTIDSREKSEPPLSQTQINQHKADALTESVQLIRSHCEQHHLPLFCTRLRHGICIRYLGKDVRVCFDAFSQIRQLLRSHWWGLESHSPRIWET